jgi:hypothetical protein
VRRLAGVGRFLYDFFVGDDWVIALIVVAAVGVTALLAPSVDAAWVVLPVAAVAVLAFSVLRAARVNAPKRTRGRGRRATP